MTGCMERALAGVPAAIVAAALLAGACPAGAHAQTSATAAGGLAGQTPVRARDLGVPLEGRPGAYNAITDVAGVEVGHTTLIHGHGLTGSGPGAARTGVTAILPRGRANLDPVLGGIFSLNGTGELTGSFSIEERGFVQGPILLTNTWSVGTVRDAALKWQLRNAPGYHLGLPVVGETADYALNDRAAFHVREDHVFAALDGAASGPVAEGNVGGGTGMICHSFKSGIGTASRVLDDADGGYTVGVLVQCNYGRRRLLRIAGVPVGREIADLMPCIASADPTVQPERPRCDDETTPGTDLDEEGSIIVIVATDAPLMPHQLARVAKRVSLGVGNMGGLGGDSSGDIFLAFSTANPGLWGAADVAAADILPNHRIDALFEATVQATEEAIINSLLTSETMVGRDYLRVHALPHDRLRALLARYGRLASHGEERGS
jgi:D-aminopeptidase